MTCMCTYRLCVIFYDEQDKGAEPTNERRKKKKEDYFNLNGFVSWFKLDITNLKIYLVSYHLKF